MKVDIYGLSKDHFTVLGGSRPQTLGLTVEVLRVLRHQHWRTITWLKNKNKNIKTQLIYNETCCTNFLNLLKTSKKHVWGKSLSHAEEFKYLGILSSLSVMRVLPRLVVVKKEFSWKAKLWIYCSVYVHVWIFGTTHWEENSGQTLNFLKEL